MIRINKDSEIIRLSLLPTKLVGESNSRPIYRHMYDGKWYSPHKLKLILKNKYNTTLEKVLVELANNLEEYDLTCPYCNKNKCITRIGKRQVLEILTSCSSCYNSDEFKKEVARRSRVSQMNTIDPITGKSIYRSKIEKMNSTKLKSNSNYYKDLIAKRDYSKSTINTKFYKDTKLSYQSSNEFRFLSKMESDGLLDEISNGLTFKNYSGSRCYYSDFYIESSNTVVEIKSKYILNLQGLTDNLKKFKKVLDEGYKLLLVLNNIYYNITNYEELELIINN